MTDSPIQSLSVELFAGIYCIVREPPAGDVRPTGAAGYPGQFFSVSISDREVSIICEQSRENLETFSPQAEIEADWSLMRIVGQLEFDMVGVISRFSALFAAANIPIFCLSTFETDYFLIKQKDLSNALTILNQNEIKWNRHHA